MRVRGVVLAVVVAASTLVGAGAARADVDAPTTCTGRELCVGAAKVVVSPSQRHIDGVVESRTGGLPRRQRFHLGGYGVNPFQGLPDPDGSLASALTEPASRTAYHGTRGPEPIWVRAMVVRQPGGPTVAFVVLDAIGAGNVIQERLAATVSRATGIAPADVLFGQTHTHAGPDLQGLWGGVPQEWIEGTLYPAAAVAVADALGASEPARLDVRSGALEEFDRYRRPRRLDPDEHPDHTASLLQARAVDDGRVVASLLQYAAHPTSVNEDLRVPHPDYPLGAVDWIERESGGVALYFNGPIADASPAGGRAGCHAGSDGAYGEVRCRGEGLAKAALALRPSRALAPSVAVRHARATVPVTNPLFLAAGAAEAFNRYYDFLDLPVAQIPGIGPAAEAALVDLPQLTPVATTAVSRVTIGGPDGLEIVTIPGEATGTFGRWVRGLADPSAETMLLGLTHNSFGYLLPEEEFSYIDESGDAGFVLPFTGYEEHVSLGPLTVPLLRTQAYGPLFEVDPIAAATPPLLSECRRALNAPPCAAWVARRRAAYVQRSLGDLVDRAGRLRLFG